MEKEERKLLADILGDDAILYVVKLDGHYAIYNATAFSFIAHAFKGNEDHHVRMFKTLSGAITDDSAGQMMVLADAITPEGFIYHELAHTIESLIREQGRELDNLQLQQHKIQTGGAQ